MKSYDIVENEYEVDISIISKMIVVVRKIYENDRSP